MRNGQDEYRRLNLEDNATFRRWLLANTVVGALALFALMAAASLPGGDTATMAQMASSAGLSTTR